MQKLKTLVLMVAMLSLVSASGVVSAQHQTQGKTRLKPPTGLTIVIDEKGSDQNRGDGQTQEEEGTTEESSESNKADKADR